WAPLAASARSRNSRGARRPSKPRRSIGAWERMEEAQLLTCFRPAREPLYAVRCSERGATMRKDLMEILACPMCKSELTLTIDEEKDDEVIRGTLFCAKCNEKYP